MNTCECGCGEVTKRNNRFINGHSGKIPHFGVKHSVESRRRISETLRGRVMLEETKQRLRDSHLGKIGPNLGRSPSEITRGRLRDSLLGHAPNEGAGRTKWYSYTRLQDDVTIKIQGSYETGTCIYLDLAEESNWLYTGTGKFKEHRLLLSDGRHWHPDFWIPRLRLYIDVKGWWRETDRAKLALEEYPDRVRVLIGDSYLTQLIGVISERSVVG
jgi:hypothetical protein